MPGDTICAAALNESEQLCFRRRITVVYAGKPDEPGQEPCGCFDEDHSLSSSETTQGGLRHEGRGAIARMGGTDTPKSGSEPKLVGLRSTASL